MAFESLTDRLAGVFKKLRGHGKLTEADIKAAMREVRMALLEADVNYKVAKDFCAKVSERAMGQEVMESLTPAQQVVKIVNEELVALMGGSEAARLNIKNKGQTVIMLCGLQGNGKTTHAAKLAKFYIKQGRRPMLVACDIYRPAAIDQLQVVGKQAGRTGVHPARRKAAGDRTVRRWRTPKITATTSSFWIRQAACRSTMCSCRNWWTSRLPFLWTRRCWWWTPWPVRTL